MNIKQHIKNGPKLLYKPARILYDRIPVKYKLGKRYKEVYSETYKFLEKSQWWSKSEHQDYQLQQIIKLVHHAYHTVPYYHTLFNEHGIKISQIQNFDDFKKIPFLTKEIIQKNSNNLISTNYNKKKLHVTTTGGSTGIPLSIFIDQNYEIARESAFIESLYKRIGYRNGIKTFILRGNIIETINEKKNKFFKKNSNTNELIASSFHLNNENFQYYSEAIKKYNPKCIKAYPSSLFLLANFILSERIEPFHNIKWVILASENIYAFQKEIFRIAFPNAHVYSFYGHTEHASLAGACELNDFYHLQSEYGYTEIVNETGSPVSGENELGEIIATSFNNLAMPFIRYKTADIAINSNEMCSCARQYKLIKGIQGREQEYIITRDGSKISLGTLNHYDFFKKVRKIQIEQNEIGKIILRIVEINSLSKKDYEEIILKIKNASGNKLDIDIQLVDDIKTTARGKHKFLIQNVSIK